MRSDKRDAERWRWLEERITDLSIIKPLISHTEIMATFVQYKVRNKTGRKNFRFIVDKFIKEEKKREKNSRKSRT